MSLYKTIKTRLEAIQKLKPPKTAEDCISIAGAVNYSSMFCQNLQMLLKPIYDLTRKGRPSDGLKYIKELLKTLRLDCEKTLELHLPDNKWRCQLFSDTSKTPAGSALYQIQNCTPTLIGYASERLFNYSIVELELLGLYVNINQFKHLLAKADFGCAVDHLALSYIMKGKTEPASTEINRILEVLIAYSFHLYYMKGKDMALSDFLPRIKVDKSNPPENNSYLL